MTVLTKLTFSSRAREITAVLVPMTSADNVSSPISEIPRGKHDNMQFKDCGGYVRLGNSRHSGSSMGAWRRVIGTVGQWIALPDNYPLGRGDRLSKSIYRWMATQGAALIHRETLDWLGVSHGPMYRACLTLSHQWWRGARTKGKDEDGVTRGTSWPYTTRTDTRGKTGQGGQSAGQKGRTVIVNDRTVL